MEIPLLAVDNLSIAFDTDEGSFTVVDGVSFDLKPGEIVGLVGESGCGKSVTALGLLRLIPSPPGRIIGGRISLDGEDLMGLPIREMRRIRGQTISMVFQEPGSALSPLHRIGRQLIETVRLHRDIDRVAAEQMAEEWLRKVRIPDPKERMSAYPHQLSGGMQQRIMIAMALMLEPRIVIADEPTTALDVTVQAQILDLMLKLRADFDTAIMMITHDLGVIAEIATRVAVMYAGKVVETADTVTVFEEPEHPYTRGLLRSIPRLGDRSGSGRERLSEIAGLVPSLYALPDGCPFAPRCESAMGICRESLPDIRETAPGHSVRCWLSESGGGAAEAGHAA